MTHRLTSAALAAALMVFGGACDDSAATSDQSASGWVDALSAAHRRADAAELRGDLADAMSALAPLAREPAPDGVAATHARAARQDLYFRLATLAAAQRDHGAARIAADAGLALGQVNDVLSANLLIARGEANESLGNRDAASADYLAALRIHDVLLTAVLGEEDI